MYEILAKSKDSKKKFTLILKLISKKYPKKKKRQTQTQYCLIFESIMKIIYFIKSYLNYKWNGLPKKKKKRIIIIIK